MDYPLLSINVHTPKLKRALKTQIFIFNLRVRANLENHKSPQINFLSVRKHLKNPLICQKYYLAQQLWNPIFLSHLRL